VDGRKDGQKDGRTDGWMDGWMERHYFNRQLCSTLKPTSRLTCLSCQLGSTLLVVKFVFQ